MAASARDIRRLAFQTLFQLDARGGDDPEALRDAADDAGRDGGGADFTQSERAKATKLALAAYNDRQRADAAMTELAPTWPASRQAAVDRALLRLAHYEMTQTKTPPKVAVNEAIELAKVFGTEKSPTFINGLLDKVLKQVLASRPADPADIPDAPEPASPDSPDIPTDPS